MHYSSDAFAKDLRIPVITPLEEGTPNLGNRKAFSEVIFQFHRNWTRNVMDSVYLK